MSNKRYFSYFKKKEKLAKFDSGNKLFKLEIKKLIEINGGKISSSISKNTSFILAGSNMGPSKKQKAEDLKIP